MATCTLSITRDKAPDRANSTNNIDTLRIAIGALSNRLFFFSNLSVRYSTLRRKIKRNIVSRVILSTVKSSPVLLIAFFFYEEEQGRCSSFLLGELEGWIDKIARKLLSMIALKRSSPFEPYFGCFVPWSLPRIKNFQDYSSFFIKENVLLNRKSQVVVIL